MSGRHNRGVQDETRFADLTVGEFAERLASSQPVPGGGSASAVAASLGASLVAMVASLSEGRPRYAEHEALHATAKEVGNELSRRLLALADEDANAFARYAGALKLPRETDEDRAARSVAMQDAARAAAEAPMRCVEACLEVAIAAEALAGRSNVNASSDVNVASLLAEAGARGAAANVLVNLSAAGDPDWADAMTNRVGALLDQIGSLAAATRETVASGQPRDPITANGR
jgi:methenyltetrahydrofolate cyclohydrolase